MKISILHPSRSRPERSYDTIIKWLEKAGAIGMTDIELIISIDYNDPSLLEYEMRYVRPITAAENYTTFRGHPLQCVQNQNRSAVDAINNAAKAANGDIFIVVSDDTDCPENWAIDLLKHLEGKTDFIAKTQDGIQKWIITNPIMDRVYYNRFGYVYYPEYQHMFCDTELSCVADLTGRRIDVPMTFEHLHYSTGKSAKDAINEKADATWGQGEALFIERASKNFGLVNYPGRITNKTYLNWLKMKGVRL